MGSLLALLSAAAYGAADFFGGIAARRATTVAAVIVSQAAGVLLLLVALPFLPSANVSILDLAWGAAAGLAGGSGVALLYHALAIGPMSVVAPVTAVCAAAIPVAAGVAFGERLAPVTAAGIVVAAAAIVLIGQERKASVDEGRRGRRPLGKGAQLVLIAGVAIGLFLVCLERTSADAGLWPLVPARAVSIGLFIVVAAASRRPMLVPTAVVRIAVTAGGLDMLANALYLLAVNQGQLSVVAPLASLYPASTILLARTVLNERWSRLQIVGIGAAIVATVLIVVGSNPLK